MFYVTHILHKSIQILSRISVYTNTNYIVKFYKSLLTSFYVYDIFIHIFWPFYFLTWFIFLFSSHSRNDTCYHANLFDMEVSFYQWIIIIVDDEHLLPIPLKLSFHAAGSEHAFYHRFRRSQTCHYAMDFTRWKLLYRETWTVHTPPLSLFVDFFFESR